MNYYKIPSGDLREKGLGGEPWRKERDGLALVSEAEVTECLGYPTSEDFEKETGAAPMTLREAAAWADSKL